MHRSSEDCQCVLVVIRSCLSGCLVLYDLPIITISLASLQPCRVTTLWLKQPICFAVSCICTMHAIKSNVEYRSLQKQSGYFNHRVVTLVAVKLKDSVYERFTLIVQTNCIRLMH